MLQNFWLGSTTTRQSVWSSISQFFFLPRSMKTSHGWNVIAWEIKKHVFFGSTSRCLFSHQHLEPQAVTTDQMNWRESSLHRRGVMLRSHRKSNSLHILHDRQLVWIYVFSMNERWVWDFPTHFWRISDAYRTRGWNIYDASDFYLHKNLNESPQVKKTCKLMSMSTCDFHV